MNLKSLAALLFCAAIPLLAAETTNPEFTRTPEGGVQIGRQTFLLRHWGKGWSGTEQSMRSVFFPGEGGTPLPGRGIMRKGTFAVSGGEFQLTDIAGIPAPERFVLEYAVDSEAGIHTEAIAVCTSIPVEDYRKRPLRLNGKPFVLPAMVDEKRWQLYGPSQGAATLELPLDTGILTVSGQFTLILQDNRRRGENDVQLRLGFRPFRDDALRHAELRLDMTFRPYRMAELNLRSAMNMGFADEAEADRTGGWTDQGPSNDLRMMRPGKRPFAGISFDIADPGKNAGKSCIVLRGANREYFPAKASVPVPDLSGRALYLLNGLAWPPAAGAVCGAVNITYADGSRQTVELKNGVDTGNFWFARPLDHAAVVWENKNETSNIGLYATKIALRAKPVKSLEFQSRGSVWMILAATIAEDEIIPVTDGPLMIEPGPEWIPLTPTTPVKKGGITDFSGFLDAPAGKYGFCRVAGEQFEFAGRPGVPARFWGANTTFSANYLDKAECDKMTESVAAVGLNMIRLHHFDQDLFGQYYLKLPIAERIDRLDYYVASCKKRGIYITLDLYTFRPVGGKAFGYPDRPLSPQEYKVLCMFDDRVLEDLVRFAGKLFSHVNPYTGLAWKDEPAIAFLNLVNENMLPEGADRTPLLREVTERKFGEYLAANRLSPRNEKERTTLRNRFLRESYASGYRKMAAAIRALGVKVPFSDTNCGYAPRVGVMRRPLDYVDNHMYWGHPSFLGKLWQPPVAVTSASATGAYAGGINILFPTRLLDKPFSITEWDYVNPNPYNVEGAFLMGSYGALQGYGALCRFLWAGSAESWLESPARLRIFDFSRDPLLRLSMRAGACFFLRGDVSPAKKTIPWLSPTAGVDSAEFDNRSPEVIQRLALMVKTGTVFESEPVPPDTVAVVAAPGVRSPAALPEFSGAYASDILRDMAKRGVLPAALFDLKTGRFTSSTGEIELVGSRKSLKTVTPKSEGFVLEAGDSLRGDFAAVENATTFCAVLAASQDGRPLRKSGRILILHLTDAKGLNMKFLDRGMSVVGDWGDPGLLMKRGRAAIRLAADPAMTLYACAPDGTRLFRVGTEATPGGIRFVADNAAGGRAVCVYELVRE